MIFSKRVSRSDLFVINFVNSSVILSPMDLRVKHVTGIPISAYRTQNRRPWDNVTIACKKKIIFYKSQPRREASEWLSDGKKFRDYFGFRPPRGALPKQYPARNMSNNLQKISVLRVVA